MDSHIPQMVTVLKHQLGDTLREASRRRHSHRVRRGLSNVRSLFGAPATIELPKPENEAKPPATEHSA